MFKTTYYKFYSVVVCLFITYIHRQTKPNRRFPNIGDVVFQGFELRNKGFGNNISICIEFS